jgi:hypothetical protein
MLVEDVPGDENKKSEKELLIGRIDHEKTALPTSRDFFRVSPVVISVATI